MRPINPNDRLPALHTLYASGTGGGKTSALKLMHLATQEYGFITPQSQVVLWDPHESYQELCGMKVVRFDKFADYARYVGNGRRTDKPFAAAITTAETRDNFLLHCTIAKGYGNGMHPCPLHVVCEEVPQVTASVAREESDYGWLLTVGRKYGHIVHSLGQRTTEMSKTTLSQSEYKWIGKQGSRADVERMAKETDCSFDQIAALNSLEFVLKLPGIGNAYTGKLNFDGKPIAIAKLSQGQKAA